MAGMNGIDPEKFRRLLNPRSIALVGASERGFSSRNALQNLRSIGYRGQIIPINPGRETVFGISCYPSLTESPRPDAVFSLIARESTVSLVKDAIAAEAGGVVLPIGGFKESGEPEWVAREAELADLAREARMPIIGPNSLGMFSGTSHALLAVGPYPWNIEPGSVALLFQSGGQMMAACRSVNHLGAGVAYAFSLGNAATTGFAELLDVLADNPSVGEIVLLIEQISDWPAFRSAAERALAAGKWVGATSVGATEMGRQAARTHTGSLATDARILKAGLTQIGVAYAHSASTLVDAAVLHARLGPARLGGIGLVSVSGGAAGLSADLAAVAGIPVPDLGEYSKRHIAEINPEITACNPLDIVSGPADRQMFRSVFETFASDPVIAASLYLPSQGLPDKSLSAHADVIENLVSAAESLDHPVIISQLLTVPIPEREHHELLRRSNVCFLPSAAEALAAIAVWRFGVEPSAAAVKTPTTAPAQPLNEHAAKGALGEYGCTIPSAVFIPAGASPDATSFAALHFPVVLKGIAPTVLHKAAAGLVRLGLTDVKSVERAMCEMLPAAKAAGFEGFLVESQASAGVDLMVSLQRERLGTVVIVAEGGGDAGEHSERSWIGVEPLDGDLRAGLDHLAEALGLTLSDRNVQALIDFVERLRRCRDAHGWRLVEVNPARLLADGLVVALDAVVLDA